MGNPNDPKLELENFAGGDDPFADPGDAEGGDPFDFGQAGTNPAPRPEGGAGEGKAIRKKATGAGASPGARQAAQLAADVPVQVVAVLGKKNTTVKEIVSLKKGQILELNRFPNEAIDLVANGKLMAKGELVEIDGKLGVRIIKIFE